MVSPALVMMSWVVAALPAMAIAETPLPPTAALARPSAVSFQSGLAGFVAAQERAIGGRVGVAVRLIESGEAAQVRGDEAFPMASTYKVAIAGTLLTLVDRGELSLDRMVAITDRDLAETGEVADHLIHPGVSLSLVNLLELMLTQSNNTATDKVLALAGGPGAVTAWLRGAAIAGQRVDRSVNAVLNDFSGFPSGTAFLDEYKKRFATASAQKKNDDALTPNPAFEADPRDTTTPVAMTDLLAKLLAGPLLKAPSRTLLIGIMERCETGASRIRGLLPAGTVVAHKTGTLGGSVNDVGMITLPQGRGHLLIAIYTKASALPEAEREHAIAEIGRSAFDYFSMR